MVDDDKPMNYAAAAAYLGRSESTLRDWTKDGRGPARIKLGEHKQSPVLFRRCDLDAYLSRHVTEVAPRPAAPRRPGRPRKAAVAGKEKARA